MIRIGLPKGRMVSDSEKFCYALGVRTRSGLLRYRAVVAELPVTVYLMKAPDVARLLARNLLDLGLAGDEWLMETGIRSDLRCFETRSYEAFLCLLMARKDHRPLTSIRSVVTPYPNLTQRLLQDMAPGSDVMTINGSSEAMVPDMADACVDVVETGSSAAVHALSVRRCFEHVTTHLVRSERCDPVAVAPIVDVLAATREFARCR